MYKALFYSLGPAEGDEVKEDSGVLKKESTAGCAPLFPKLQGLKILEPKKRILSGSKKRNLCTFIVCLSGHLATGCWLSEERELMPGEYILCLYLDSLESLGFSFIIHPTQSYMTFCPPYVICSSQSP